MKKFFFFFLIIGAVSACRGPKAEDKKPELYANNSPRLTDLKFVQRRVDFGVVTKDTILCARYDFINTGKDSLIINYVAPDCSCTGYELSKKEIAPNDSAYILLKLSTKDKAGPVEIYSTVAANTQTKLYSLQILADVR